MNHDPHNLGIPFPPRDWFWLRAVLVVFAVCGLLAWIYPDFGIPYLVTAVFALPILGPWLLSVRFQQWSFSLRWISRLLLLALVFAYLKFAKSVLVPAVLIKIGG
jgi:hypothetical protein